MEPDNKARRGQSRFVANTAALGTSTVFAAVLTLVQVKILAAFLTLEDFGLFAALRGFSLLVAMLAANGFPQLLIRFLPHYESKKQLSRALVLSGLCFLAPLFLLTVFVFVIESNRAFFFGFASASLPASAESVSNLILWIYATTLGVTLKLLLYGGLNGLRRLPAQVTLELSSVVVQVVWIYLWRDHLTMTRLFMILGVTSLAVCAAGLPWYWARLFRDTTPGTVAADSGNGKPNGYLEYWLGATGLSMVAVAFTDVDRFVLSQVLALEILSLFHVGSRVLRLANRFLAVPILAFQPEVTRLDAEGRQDAIESATRVFFKFNAAIAVAVAVALWALAPDAVRLISSARYDAAVPLLRILVMSIPLTAMTAPLTSVMKALDQVRRALYCDVAWAVTYLFLLITLSATYGLVGAGIAQVAASLIQLTLAVALTPVRIGAGYGRLLVTVVAKTALCAGVAFAPLTVAGVLMSPSPVAFAVKIALLVLALFVYRTMARIVHVFDAVERDALIDLLRKRGFGGVARRIV